MTNVAFSQSQRGQVLVLAALMMTVLLGLSALAVDVSAAYMAERWERSVADAASLAGAQDLQVPGTRALPTETERAKARQHAWDVLASQLGGPSKTGPAGDCLTAGGCAMSGTDYRVSIITPSPSCLDCESSRAVQVSVWQPSFKLTFGRILGQNQWQVRATSVAGVVHARQYALVALRPPSPRNNASDANEKNLQITGGSKVYVANGDVVTNTNMFYGGGGGAGFSQLILDPDYNLYYYDPYKLWSGNPTGVQTATYTDDPNYTIPDAPTDPRYRYADEAEAMGTKVGHPAYDANYAARCSALQASVPDSYRELKTNQLIRDPLKVTAVCLRPGVYRYQVVSATTQTAYLLAPGVYFFDFGVTVSESLIGGFVPDQAGVALVFKEASSEGREPGRFTTKTATSLLAMNYGSAYLNSSGKKAKAATGPTGPVQTIGDRPLPLTVMVRRDPNCIVGLTTPPDCKDSENSTLTLTGGGNIFLAGVQYAPSDNADFKGNSTSAAEIGQLWSWTLKFDSSVFRLTASNTERRGVLRLDRACSPGNLCVTGP